MADSCEEDDDNVGDFIVRPIAFGDEPKLVANNTVEAVCRNVMGCLRD